MRQEIEVPGGRNWVPWIGLAMVLPAVIILMIAAFGILFSTAGGAVGDASGIGVGVLATIGVLIGLILATVGLVRAYRKPSRQSVGLEGMALEIGVLAIAVVALILVVVVAF